MSHLQPLEAIYQSYIAAINAQDWKSVAQTFSRPTVTHNGRTMTSTQYAEMIKTNNAAAGENLVFVPSMLVVDSSKGLVACRVMIEGASDGKVIWENVFYQWVEEKISEVFSMIEKA